MKQVITISREFGSGGREIGFRVAEKLGIPFYDSEIISLAAEDNNIAEDVFHAHDEVIRDDEEEHSYQRLASFTSIYEVPVSDQIFLLQSQMIKKLAMLGPCVIIGRCSDMIVEDSFNVFICAGMKKCIERIMAMEPDTDIRTLESQIRQIDGKRREYYQYYSGNEWGNPRNYHISLNSGKLGIEACVDTIISMVQRHEGI